jgi:hypothetical protein
VDAGEQQAACSRQCEEITPGALAELSGGDPLAKLYARGQTYDAKTGQYRVSEQYTEQHDEQVIRFYQLPPRLTEPPMLHTKVLIKEEDSHVPMQLTTSRRKSSSRHTISAHADISALEENCNNEDLFSICGDEIVRGCTHVEWTSMIDGDGGECRKGFDCP